MSSGRLRAGTGTRLLAPSEDGLEELIQPETVLIVDLVDTQLT